MRQKKPQLLMIASSRALNYLDAPCLIILIKKSVLCQLSWFNILTLNDERMLLLKRGWKKIRIQ
jgi:hypothetical protein